MGVTGSGKSTIGKALAKRLQIAFFDGDDFHPAENIARMSKGIPLTDADRLPWLQAIRKEIDAHLSRQMSAVFACSALKESYRVILTAGRPDVKVVHLAGSAEIIAKRLAKRSDHFMDPTLLTSQFEALETPTEASVVSIEATPEEIVDRILELGTK